MNNSVLPRQKFSQFLRKTAIAVISGVLCISLSACGLLPKEEEVLAPPLKEPEKVNYDTEVVKRGTIEKKVTCIGTFVSVSQHDMYFKYKGGRLKSINVKHGEKVKPGDVIAELDTDGLESQIKQQELALRKAQLSYNRLKSDMAEGRESADIETLRLQLNDLQRQYDKVEAAAANLKSGLRIQDIFPGVDMENLRSQIDQKKLAILKAQDTFKRDLENAAISVETEQLKLNDLLVELEKSKLVAPIAGEVVYIDNKVNQGDSIAAYKLLVKIADPTQLQLQYSDSSKTSDFRQGMKVDVKVNSKMYQGEVVMTPANAPLDADDITKKSIRVRVNDLPKDVQIGNSGDISLTLEKRENILVIPRNAVKFFNGRKYVQIFEDNVKKERDVETGIETVSEVEIMKGIKEGDKLIIR